MAKKEWFRKTRWTEADQADFFAHLHRVRSPGMRAQYLRVQASHLRSIGSKEAALDALALLEKLFSEYPDDFHCILGLVEKAECCRAVGQLDESFQAYREAMAAELRRPNIQTYAWLAFGRAVVESGRRDLFPEALKILQSTKRTMLTAREMFYSHAILAIIFESMDRMPMAREAATIAFRNAAVRHSGLRYHPTLGLLDGDEKRTAIYSVVERLADIASHPVPQDE